MKISSPNDAMTVLKTRFVREDNPDIIGIGGDINYSNFIDADMLMDISDFDGLADIKENYLTICENLKFIPTEGTYSVPYVMSFLHYAMRLKQKEFFRFIWATRIHGPVFLHGTVQ